MAALDQSKHTLTVSIELAWWLRVYLNTLIVLCHKLDCELNMERVGFWVSRGVKVRVI